MIGVYGGTFDPIHYGHLRTALEIQTLFKLDAVRLVPCANPPHRAKPSTSATMRLEMLQLALANQSELVADASEIQRSGPSYTVDTLRDIRQTLGNEPLLLFMGMDAFDGIEKWHQWQHLFDYAHVVVMTRPGFKIPMAMGSKIDKLTHSKLALQNSPNGKLFFQAVTQLDISATAIRSLIAAHQSPRFLLPDSVIDYIQHHHLYEHD